MTIVGDGASQLSSTSRQDSPVLDFDHMIVGSNEPSIVGDDDQGATALLLLLAQEREDLVAPFVVEVSRRLIGKQHDRVLDQCPRDRHALLLAAREFRRLVCEPVAQADLAESVFCLGTACPTSGPAG